MDKQQIERDSVERGLTGPRITLETMEAEIGSEHYFTALDGALSSVQSRHGSGINYYKGDFEIPFAAQSLSLLTICVIVLRNGFTVTGESACASPLNFNAELGRKIARDKAMDKVASHLAFRLRDDMQSETGATAP